MTAAKALNWLSTSLEWVRLHVTIKESEQQERIKAAAAWTDRIEPSTCGELASFLIDVYYSKVLVGQTQHLCMDALNRRAKRHQF